MLELSRSSRICLYVKAKRFIELDNAHYAHNQTGNLITCRVQKRRLGL